MPSEPLPSTNASTFLLSALRQSTRLDGRAFSAYRPISLTFGDAPGTAEVQLGKTRVLAKIACEVTAPYPDRKFDGVFTITTELSPMGSPSFEVGRYVRINQREEFGEGKALTDSIGKTLRNYYYRGFLRRLYEEAERWILRVCV